MNNKWKLPPAKKIKNNWFWIILFLVIFFLIVFSGCGGSLNSMGGLQQNETGKGVLAGAAGVKVLERIKEVFTPVYPFYYAPIEVCSILPLENFVEDTSLVPDYLQTPEVASFEKLITDHNVQVRCIIAPCLEDMSCDRTEPLATFLARNKGKFSSIEVTSYGLSAAKEFCAKNELDCIDLMAGFQDGSLLVEIRE